jgi:hypothetical protein
MRWLAAQALAWIIKRVPLELKDWTSDMGPDIESAGKMLAGAMSAGHVRAWGRRTPHALIEQIPSDQFRISGLTLIVSPSGELTTSPPRKWFTYEGIRWQDIEFDADEIRRAFPRPPPPSATEWMLKEAEAHLAAGTIGKRAVMIRDCMTATSCTKRQAEAAHKSLPDEFKRQRGKPPKNSG